MTPASLLPPEEEQRLRSLHHYLLEPALHEPVFEEVVQLTAHIFNLPISLISLVAEAEVTYLANRGVPGLVSQPRVEALCSLVVRQHKVVLFTDLQQQAQAAQLTTSALATVQARNYRFYAGTPLLLPDQRAIGALCVLDHQPRQFSADEQVLLAQLARVVAQALAVRHYCLADGLGEEHWRLVQALLVEEVGALTALVHYLGTRIGTRVPVAPDTLAQVSRRLDDIEVLLTDYYRAKRA